MQMAPVAPQLTHPPIEIAEQRGPIPESCGDGTPEGLVHGAVCGKLPRSGNKQIGGILVSPRPSWKMRFCGTVVADARSGEPFTRRARCIHSSRLFSVPVGSVLHRYRAGDAVGCGRMANL